MNRSEQYTGIEPVCEVNIQKNKIKNKKGSVIMDNKKNILTYAGLKSTGR